MRESANSQRFKGFAVLMLGMGFAKAAIAEINIEKTIPTVQREILDQDFRFLPVMNISSTPESAELAKILGLKQGFSGRDLERWIKDRVKLILPENFDVNSNLVYGQKVQYPVGSQNPPAQRIKSKLLTHPVDSTRVNPRGGEPGRPASNPTPAPIATPSPSPSPTPQRKSFVVMSNLGVGVYKAGKSSSRLLGVRTENQGVVWVRTPRVGFIQIGEGLFHPALAANKKDPHALSNRYGRIAVFIHEARHSDGNGQSLGFLHVQCPKGHDMEGLYACDQNSNGPYTLGAHALKAMISSCQDCGTAEKGSLKFKMIDSYSRVLDPVIWDEKEESL